jgi:hypothetical protein
MSLAYKRAYNLLNSDNLEGEVNQNMEVFLFFIYKHMRAFSRPHTFEFDRMNS